MKVSIIIEWENVILSEIDRCKKMLNIVYNQSLELNMPVEILILNNPEQVETNSVKSIVDDTLNLSQESIVDINFYEAFDCHYYELKNFGANLASGDIIVFVDTDVIPENNWLPNLVMPIINDESIDLVAGHTYIDPTDLVNKAFALGWFFPMRVSDGKIENKVEEFYANNVAFRKEVFDKYKFPAMPFGMTRGSCEMLADKLNIDNINMIRNYGAQTSHPAPNGWSHIIIRALANGRDRLLRKKMKTNSILKSYLYIHSYAFGRLNQTYKRSIQKYDYFELSFKEKIQSYLLMSLYYSFLVLGATITSLSPKLTKNWWRV